MSSPVSRPPGLDRRLLHVAAIAVVVLAAASTVAWAAAAGQFRSGDGPVLRWAGPGAYAASCSPPALPGTVVDVSTADMGGRRWRGGGWSTPSGRHGWGGGSMMGGGPMMGAAGGWPRMMSVSLSRTTVPAGTLSLRVSNTGVMTHEVVVLPLAAGQQPGARTVRADGTVAEAGLVAEAARTCGAGDGDGITAGATGWVTMTLRPGTYELLCNLPGHYWAGMSATLRVT